MEVPHFVVMKEMWKKRTKKSSTSKRSKGVNKIVHFIAFVERRN